MRMEPAQNGRPAREKVPGTGADAGVTLILSTAKPAAVDEISIRLKVPPANEISPSGKVNPGTNVPVEAAEPTRDRVPFSHARADAPPVFTYEWGVTDITLLPDRATPIPSPRRDTSRSTSIRAHPRRQQDDEHRKARYSQSQAGRHERARSDNTGYAPRKRTLRERDVSQSVLNDGFSLKPLDFAVKPLLEDLFRLDGIQSGDSSLPIQRNMVTRDLFAFPRLGHVLHENAFRARMSP